MSQIANSGLPSWLMILIFLITLVILAMMGSLFVFVLGAILEIIVFSIGYNATKSQH